MAVKFNPFTGQLQIDEKGSGGASYIDGEVATYNDLPLDGTAALDSAWLVRSASGVWPVSRKQAGIYIRTATAGSSRDADYTYAGTMPDVFSDAVFTLYDEASTTRTGQFNLGSITAGQNRVLTWPDGNGTIARTSDIPSTFAASAVTSGVFDNARINWAAPSAIGSTTPNTGAFSTLSANNGTITSSAPALTMSQTWNGTTSTAFHLCTIGITNSTPWTVSAASSTLFRCQLAGSNVFSVAWGGDVSSSGVVTSTSGLNTNGQLQLSSNVNLRAAAVSNALDVWTGGALDVRLWSVGNPNTSATNFERLSLRGQTGGAFIIGTEKGGTGSARALEFQTDGTTRASVTTGGNFWVNNQLILGTTVLTRITSPGDGVVTLFDSGQASFNRLQFGGTTSSFPALKRSSTTLQVRLADDSAFAAFECAGLTLNGNLTASTRDIVTDTTTGTKIATGTTQKLGFWNATPAAQPAAVADATDAASTQARLNDLLARLRTIGLIAT